MDLGHRQHRKEKISWIPALVLSTSWVCGHSVTSFSGCEFSTIWTLLLNCGPKLSFSPSGHFHQAFCHSKKTKAIAEPFVTSLCLCLSLPNSCLLMNPYYFFSKKFSNLYVFKFPKGSYFSQGWPEERLALESLEYLFGNFFLSFYNIRRNWWSVFRFFMIWKW